MLQDVLASNWTVDLMVIPVAGLLSGFLCKRMSVSLLVGYLVVGADIREFNQLFSDTHAVERLPLRLEYGILMFMEPFWPSRLRVGQSQILTLNRSQVCRR